MNKKLLTLAVAAALTAPTAAMAEAVLYGDLQVSIDYADVDGGFNGWGMNGGGEIPGKGDRDNQIGVKGSEDLGNGLKAIYEVQFNIELTEEGDGRMTSGGDNLVSLQKTYAGLSSDWGTVIVGRNDTPMYKSTSKLDLFDNQMADYNNVLGFQSVRADNSVSYVSPSFSGFQLSGMIFGGGATTDLDETTNQNQDAFGSYSLAGMYKNGPFFAALAYESMDAELWMDTDLSNDKLSLFYREDDYTKWRIGLGLLDWNGFTLTGIYEDQSDINGIAARNRSIWQIQTAYAFGNNKVKAMYGAGDRDGWSADSDYESWAIGFDHNLSKRTMAYVLYNQYIDDIVSQDWDGFSIGMMHHF